MLTATAIRQPYRRTGVPSLRLAPSTRTDTRHSLHSYGSLSSKSYTLALEHRPAPGIRTDTRPLVSHSLEYFWYTVDRGRLRLGIWV